MPFADTLMSPRDVILSKISHAVKEQTCLSHMYLWLQETMTFRDEAQSRNDAGQGRQNYTYAVEISLTDILNSKAIAVTSI